MSDIVERLKGKKPIDTAKLDKLADGADEITHGGKTYRRRGPKDQLSQPGAWRQVKEGMDDADDGSPLRVTGPQSSFEGDLAQEADAVFGAAERLAGLIDRRANAGNPQLLQRLRRVHMELSDIVELIDT